jgi:peptide/nickel transport system substrate-binding protein
MKPSGLLLLAAVSLVLGMSTATAAPASTRPRYGGTLRVAMREAPASLDPVDSAQFDTIPLHSISRLIFDTLVALDARGQTQPGVSSSWRADPGDQRWQFIIRRGVAFHDGTAVTSDAVAASLRAANSKWKVFATGDAVVIECDAPNSYLPAVLALPRYGIAKRTAGKLSGSGPFAISGWDPGKKLTLTAGDDYWGGRAFIDTIEIEMGKSFRDQMIALDLGKADIIEVEPEQARLAVVDGRRLENSAPAEWMALVFERNSQSTEEGLLRQALSLSIDRAAMNDVLLQGGGEPAGTFLPGWMTGYAFLFPSTVDRQRVGEVRSGLRTAPSWALSYEASDPLARVMAERIALNARDAGLTLQPTNSKTSDLRLVRMAMPSLDARLSLSEFAARLGLFQPKFDGDPASRVYSAESALLKSERVIPLLHLRAVVALSGRVKGWQEDPDGGWHLENVWLEMEKP